MTQQTLRLFDGYGNTSPQLRPLVLQVQKALRGAGYNVKVDGLFGRSTEAELERFQRDHGLEDDGIVGPNTWSALLGNEPPAPTPEGVDPLSTFGSKYPKDCPPLRNDAVRARAYEEIIRRQAAAHNLPACLVVAIGSRESRWGDALSPKGPAGTGDHGHGRGLMQVDDRFHKEFVASGKWRDAESNIDKGLDIFTEYYRLLEKRTSLKGPALLRATVASYNCGPGNVLKALARGLDVDHFTTGRNYSSDVLGRARWFQGNGW